MKKILLLLFVLPLLFACGNNIKFNQVGYFKGENKLRYYTIEMSNSSDFDIEDLYDEIKEHGSNQMNTEGEITASYYYFDKAPNITNCDNAVKANNVIYEAKPFASVWIMPTGKINLIKNPE